MSDEVCLLGILPIVAFCMWYAAMCANRPHPKTVFPRDEAQRGPHPNGTRVMGIPVDRNAPEMEKHPEYLNYRADEILSRYGYVIQDGEKDTKNG